MQKDTTTRDTNKDRSSSKNKEEGPCIIGEESPDSRFSTQQEEKTEQKIRKEEIWNLDQNIRTTLGFV